MPVVSDNEARLRLTGKDESAAAFRSVAANMPRIARPIWPHRRIQGQWPGRRYHGVGQLPVQPTQAPGLTHDCFLDLSRLTTFPPAELANAKDCGTASRELLIKVISTLNEGIRTLTQRQINSAVSSLFACIKPICVQLPEDTGELSSERRSYGEIPGGGAAARGRRFESTFAVSPGKYSRR